MTKANILTKIHYDYFNEQNNVAWLMEREI